MEARDRPPELTELEQAVASAIADLAATSGRDLDEIEVTAVERVTWRDGSLGCPQPGRAYTQALRAGYRIELRLGGSTVWYHGARGAPPFRCTRPAPPAALHDPGR